MNDRNSITEQGAAIDLAVEAVAAHDARMITGAQIRAARALLGWSAKELADKSGVSYPTIQRAESVNGLPTMKTPNMAALQSVFEQHGIAFGAGDGRVWLSAPAS